MLAWTQTSILVLHSSSLHSWNLLKEEQSMATYLSELCDRLWFLLRQFQWRVQVLVPFAPFHSMAWRKPSPSLSKHTALANIGMQ